LKEVFPLIEKEPFQGNELTGPLRGLRSHHIQIKGIHYRIIYEIRKETIGIIMVSTRENVYKKIRKRI